MTSIMPSVVAPRFERRRESWLNSFIRKHGRTFCLSMLGIVNSTALSVLSLGVLMWGPKEAMPYVGGVVLGFSAVLSVALAFYNGQNALIEFKHAAMGTAENRNASPLPNAAAPPRRPSGMAHMPPHMGGDLRHDDESDDT